MTKRDRIGWWLIGGSAALVLAMYLIFQPWHPAPYDGPHVEVLHIVDPPTPQASSATPDPRIAETVKPDAEGRLLLPDAAALARTLNAPDGSAEQDVQTLSTLLELFRRANDGAIPAGGLNEEITAQMLGKNGRHLAVLPQDCPGLDSAGRLLDRWGRPYFLHPLSREILEIRSAGPDGKFGTADDVEVGEEAGAGIRR
jgi:hypothetical protein